MKTLSQSIRLLALLTLLTGGLYPLLVWGVAQAVLPHEAEGSLVVRQGRVVGSELLAQKTELPRYFHPRPSAGDFATIASGASNLAWSSSKLATLVGERRAVYPAATAVPGDLLTASGSGLDPDLSPEAVRLQAARVAQARGFDVTQRRVLDELITQSTVGGQLTPARVNVLALNLALDIKFPTP